MINVDWVTGCRLEIFQTATQNDHFSAECLHILLVHPFGLNAGSG